MTLPRIVSADVARRYLALHHFLAPARSLPPGPASVMAVVDRFGTLQFDPIDIAGRNHDLVLASRVEGYRRDMTEQLLYVDRVLYETYNKSLSIVPTAELPLYRITWDLNRAEHEGGAFDEHAPLVEELLERIRASGAMSATDVPARAAIDWYWRPTNQVRAILEALAEAGILGLARRDGNRRMYDLSERLFPAELLAERRTEPEQRRHKLLSRYRAHGLLGASGPAEIWPGTGKAPERAARRAELVAAGAIVPVEVDGIRGSRYVPATELDRLAQAEAEIAAGRPPGGRPPTVAFLAPLDPLVWDRDLLRSLYAFDYIWEVYVPAPKRRWGYYVLPLLFGDRIVGRIEPRADRATGILRVIDLWWEDGIRPLDEPGLVEALADALASHVAFTGMRRLAVPRTGRHRDLAVRLRSSPATAALLASRGPRPRSRATAGRSG